MPDGNRIFSQKLTPKGRFKFTSAESGEHSICFFASASGWFSSTKIVCSYSLTFSPTFSLLMFWLALSVHLLIVSFFFGS